MKKSVLSVLVACLAALLLGSAPVCAKAARSQGDVITAAQDEVTYDVILKEVGVNKVKVVKILRTYLEVDLKVAYEMAQKAPVTVKEAMAEKDAKALEKELAEAGATVELKQAKAE